MSWLDELSELERRAEVRRAELEPQVAQVESLLAEYRDVMQVLDRLSRQRAGESSPESATATATPARPATRKRAARKSKPARAAKRRPAARTSAARKPAARKAAAEASPAKPAARKAPAEASPAKPAARKAPAEASPAKPAAGSDRGGRRNAARPGERERQLLELVAARPGITVTEVAAELSVDPTGLYGIVRRLQGKGRLNKDGMGLTIGAPATEAVAAAGPA